MNWRGVVALAGALSLWDGSIYAAEVLRGPARVVDGDTLWVGSTPVRLAGMDAPEVRQPCRGPGGEMWACGVVATRALRAAVGDGEVACRVTERDVYWRWVGTCTSARGEDLGEEMVAAGLAAASGSRYAAEERAARGHRMGVWAGEWSLPWNWRRSGSQASRP